MRALFHRSAVAGFALVASLSFGASCKQERRSPEEPREEPATPSPAPEVEVRPSTNADSTDRRSVVLVTIDGVAWEDLFRSAEPREVAFRSMPKTKALILEEGVALGGGRDPSCGVVKPDNPTFLSLPGYAEILSGRRTRCGSNTCRTRDATVLDDVALDSSARGLGPVASLGSWEGIARVASAGRSPVLVSAGRMPWPHRPIPDPLLEEAVAASHRSPDPSPGHGLYRRDELTEKIAISYLRAERPRLLHVALGDTDEHGHANNRAGYLLALRMADLFIAELEQTLDELHMPAAIIVTTDHGRAKDFRDHGSGFPESGRSFVLAFGDGVAKRGILCEHRDVSLPDVGATIRRLLVLPADDHADRGEPIEELLADGVR